MQPLNDAAAKCPFSRDVEENVRASDITLTDKELAVIDEVSPHGVAAGGRYDERGMRAVDV